MHRTITLSTLFVSLELTTFFSYATANFGFTSGGFNYVQLSSPQVISWNDATGDVELRMMVYPADAVLSYVRIAANLTHSSYTWIPTLFAPGSQWTLEGVDSAGNIAASTSPFTIQGVLAPGAVTATPSLQQQDPSSTSTTDQNTPSSTGASSQPSNSNNDNNPDDSNNGIPTTIKIAILVGVMSGLIGIGTLATFLILRHRQKTRRPKEPEPFELQDNWNASTVTLEKPMELQGSIDHLGGTSETSWGRRAELMQSGPSRKSMRVSIATGAVETSMGKRMELG